MKVPVSWLKDFVDIDIDIKELADKLVKSGFEVEDFIDLSAKIKNVVAGKILEIIKHPNADKLLICKLLVNHEILQIVTHANNISVNDIVPVALDGAILPNGTVIKTGELRGVKSEGMLCSGKELEIDDYDYEGAEVDGILLLKNDVKIGTDINKLIGNDDYIIDVAITANRPDCNSIIGVAREVAAITDKKLKLWKDIPYSEINNNNKVKVTILNKTLCPHYMAKQFNDIVIKRSPDIIAKRLKMVGIRPINNIVDLTNYILIEIGQPMHAFDRNIINNIVVRNAIDNEKIVTLDEKEHILDKSMLVIADENKPLAVAGIMGGSQSGINDKTNSIVLESAKFARDNIRRTSRKINLHSDSSARFEKGIDYYSQTLAINRAINLITKYQWGKVCEGVVEVIDKPADKKTINFTVADIKRILGIEIPVKEIVRILNNLSIKTTVMDNILTSDIPEYRDDLININDLSEEIIRIYSYDNIKSTLMDGAKQTQGGYNEKDKFINKIKESLVYNGLSEILTYSFTTPKYLELLNIKDKINPIKLLNPLGEDLSVMRTTLIHSMISTLYSNIVKGNKSADFFEISKTFISKDTEKDELPYENNRLAIGIYGENADFYRLKNLIINIISLFVEDYKLVYSNKPYFHNGISADIIVNNECIGSFGLIHPLVKKNYELEKDVYIADLDLDKIYEIRNNVYSYRSMSKFPMVERDLALLVKDNILSIDLINCIKENGGENLISVKVFDMYKGNQIEKGFKSLAYNLEFKADRTLTEQEVNDSIDKIIKNLREKYDAKIRE